MPKAEKYIQSGGTLCPHCGSDEIEAGRVEADAGCAWSRVVCCCCEAEWRDVYVLSDVVLTNVNEEEVNDA